MIDAVSAIKQYDYSGKLIRDIQLPGLGTAGGFSGRKDKMVYYSFTNYTTPERYIRWNLNRGISSV
jgi:prolyl oligopeptidase